MHLTAISNPGSCNKYQPLLVVNIKLSNFGKLPPAEASKNSKLNIEWLKLLSTLKELYSKSKKKPNSLPIVSC